MTRPAHASGPARTPFLLLIGGLIAGGIAVLLALNTAAAADELRRHDLAGRAAGLDARIVDLRAQIAASAAPGALARAAARLGMIPNPNPAFLSIGPNGSVAVLGSAAPASVVVPPPTSTPKPTPAGRSAGRGTTTPARSATVSGPAATPTSAVLPGGPR